MDSYTDDKNEEERKIDSSDVKKDVSNQYASSSILLFLNQLIVAFGNWIFWMAISKFATTEEIGQSTTIYSLVLFFTTIIQFGLEYPILKYSYNHRKSILSSALAIEISLSLLSIPFLIVTFDNFYDKNLVQFEWLAVAMIFLTIPGFVAHFVLLGLFRVRAVLVIDILATISKFVVGFILVLAGMGSFGILIAFVVHISIMSFFSFYLTRGDLVLKLDVPILKSFLREGMVNTPSRISRIFIFSLSVVLLALFNIDAAQIGIFYIAITISLVAGGFATNIALMVIPASTKLNDNTAPTGLRIGLSFTIPFIILLITHPATILGLIGQNYVSASLELAILGLSILPASIAIIAISEFNNRHQLKRILTIGITEISIFLISFALLVPTMGIMGAALSTLIAFFASSILAVFWINRISIKYITNSIVSLVSGFALWMILAAFLGDTLMVNTITILAILLVSTGIAFYLNKITMREIKGMIHALYKKGKYS